MPESTRKYEFWLIFGRNGSVRTTKRAPGLEINERAMQCSVNLPESIFTRPSLKATIQVPSIDTAVPEINIEAAETALSEVLGATVAFEVIPPEQEAGG